MATLKDFRDERLKKLEELKKLGVNPYPADSERTHKTGEVVDGFDKLEGETVTVVGRIVTKRDIGKLAFIVIKDDSGKIQLFLKDGDVADPDYSKSEIAFDNIGLLDSGDFVQASGEVVKTKTGEISVAVKHLRILTKAIRPMPSSYDGFSNKEERLRRRYIDTNMNTEVYERYIRRSKFWDATRDFLKNEKFTEINVPILEHTTGGADAKPFKTHMDAIDEDFFLRISHELPLKRLIGGGYERVFDIGPRFRNENYSDEHLPEHIAFESYAAFQDYSQAMEMYERQMKEVAEKTWGTLKFKDINGFEEVDLSEKWPVVKYPDIMKERFGVDVFNPDLDQLKKILKENNVKLDGDVNVLRAMDSVWKIIRRESAGPFWLIHEPVEISPLAKQDPQDSRVTQRFHPVIAGTEMGNGYSELNDPQDQLERFLEQEKLREGGDEEAQMLDIDFVEMLEYGMPPATGWSYSERFFWMMEGVTAREGVPFPQLRWEIDQVTKSIYPDVNFDKLKVADKNPPKKIEDLPSDDKNQFVMIVNKEVPTEKLLNAASHVTNGFIGTVTSHEGKFDYVPYSSKDGDFDSIISHYATVVLKANKSSELAKTYKKLKEMGIECNAFTEDMTAGSSKEQVELLSDKNIGDLNFYALTFFGEKEKLKEITKKFQLYKG